ncbi:MAG TPA: hypothetical protein VK772_02860 [Puia sp.]|nr:hypothetical protein [Puia sp.]
MLTLHEKCLLIFVFSDVDFSAVNGIAYQSQEIIFTAFNASFINFLSDLVGGENTARNLMESPLNDGCVFRVRPHVFTTIFTHTIGVSNGRLSHITAFLSRSAHTEKSVQRAAIVLYLRSCEIKCEHHFIFGYREIKGLFDGLGFDA